MTETKRLIKTILNTWDRITSWWSADLNGSEISLTSDQWQLFQTSGINPTRTVTSDVKRGQNIEAEADAEARVTRPRPELRGRGQFLEVEAKAEAKNNYEKSTKMINNIRFKVIAGKINKIPEFYTIFVRKMLDYIIRQRDRGHAEAKCLRPRPRTKLRGRGQILASRT